MHTLDSTMLVDAHGVPDGSVMAADVCIVGGGAAGITIARELSHRSFRVALLESGGLTADEATQSLYGGETRGVPYFPLDAIRTRARYFGGTTNEWAGECRPLDPMDFDHRAWVPHSGWPIGPADLLPFYGRAQELCQLGPFAYAIEDWLRHGIRPIAFPGERLRSLTLHQSPPTRFAEAYGDDIRGADNVTAYLNASVVELEAPAPSARIHRARVARLSSGGFHVEARLFVLAAGGIENARLLLMSRSAAPAGLGNAHDQVGRYFMEHLYLDRAASILAPKGGIDAFYTDSRLLGGYRVRGLVGLTAAVQQQERLTNFCAIFDEETAQASARWGRELLGALARREPPPAGGLAHLRNVISSLAGAGLTRVRGDRRPRRRRLYVVKNVMEQAPNPDSRVVLSEARDRLGCPRVVLDWRLSAIDRRTAHRAHVILREELARAGIGRLRSAMGRADGPWPRGLRGARHHMGTTRMSRDPRHGVVDADCRVHGTENLYVAGSSVFPTSGSANPTLTIVALALRLARRIESALGA
ncbi:MAG: GMC family oxidoreductase [Candidatus Rokuibacteriota bacterium]